MQILHRYKRNNTKNFFDSNQKEKVIGVKVIFPGVKKSGWFRVFPSFPVGLATQLCMVVLAEIYFIPAH